MFVNCVVSAEFGFKVPLFILSDSHVVVIFGPMILLSEEELPSIASFELLNCMALEKVNVSGEFVCPII